MTSFSNLGKFIKVIYVLICIIHCTNYEIRFITVEELKDAIKKDIDESVSALDVDDNNSYRNHSFFTAGGEIPILSSSNFVVLNHHTTSEKYSSVNGFHHSNNRQNS